MKPLTQVRVLVVDDDPEVAGYLDLVLKREGYDVTVLHDPTLVTAELRAHEYHLLVLDMMMPKLSGLQVLEQVRRDDSDLAVIVATAFATVDTAVASLKLSASDYVKKPVEPEELLSAVSNALKKKGMTRDPEVAMHRAIGQSIRDGRTKQNLTLRQLARRSGLSTSLLSQIERAESSPSLSSLHRIASALKMKVGALFGDL